MADQYYTTSLYRYFDEYGVPIYIGITSTGTVRNSQHNNDKSWWRFVASQQVEHFVTRESAAERERELIAAYHPPFNRIHNPYAAESRATYLAFRSDPAARSDDLSGVWRGLNRRLPLDIRKEKRPDSLMLVSRLMYVTLSACVEIPQIPRHVVAFDLQHGKKIGNVTRAEHVGPVLLFRVRNLPSAAQFKTSFVSLKMISGIRNRYVVERLFLSRSTATLAADPPKSDRQAPGARP